MIVLLDKGILFLSLFFVTFLSTLRPPVIPTLFVISFSSLITYWNKKIISIFSFIIYCILCIFLPDLIYFLPLIVYDLWHTDFQFYSLFALIPICFCFSYSLSYFIMISFFGISYFFKYKTEKLDSLKKNYMEYQDKMKELSSNLQEKNAELLKKQDYEIHIATLNERNRIAMEIHDNIGHLLSSSILQIAAIQTKNKDSSLQESLKTVNNTLSSAMDSIRKSVHHIYHESLHLETQLQSIVDTYSFCPVYLDYSISNNPKTTISYCIISIVKEALCNITKHSNASQVKITLQEHPCIYQLIIQDNGTNASLNFKSGIGIQNMENRVCALNGHCYFTINNGFRIFISLPKGED